MTTVKIDLESLDLNLNANQTYVIEVEEGFVDSNYDNSLNDSQTFNYTVQPASTSLTLTDVNPDLGDTNVFLGIVEFVFDDRIRVDNGNFYLYKDTNPDTLVLTIPHNDSRVNVTDNKIRINVSGLLENTTTYYMSKKTTTEKERKQTSSQKKLSNFLLPFFQVTSRKKFVKPLVAGLKNCNLKEKN